MRKIDDIIIHCTATPCGREVSVEEVRRWHKARGFSDIGYHYLIALDGTVSVGRPMERAGAHCKGHNARSVGVCYVGGTDALGKPADTRTPQQKRSLRNLVAELRRRFPEAAVHGHNDYAAKACPCFRVADERWQ